MLAHLRVGHGEFVLRERIVAFNEHDFPQVGHRQPFAIRVEVGIGRDFVGVDGIGVRLENPFRDGERSGVVGLVIENPGEHHPRRGVLRIGFKDIDQKAARLVVAFVLNQELRQLDLKPRDARRVLERPLKLALCFLNLPLVGERLRVDQRVGHAVPVGDLVRYPERYFDGNLQIGCHDIGLPLVGGRGLVDHG